MNPRNRLFVLCLSGALVSAPSFAEQTARPHRVPSAKATGSKQTDHVVPQPEAPVSAKRVLYTPQDVAPIKTKLRYTTLIILPRDEVILDFVCGDKDLWVINGEQNLAYVKPAKEDTQTNLNLITESGNVYSFVLSEVSGKPSEEPDLKVFVELKDGATFASEGAPRRFVPVRELEAAQQEADLAHQAARQVKASSQAAIDAGISQFVTNVRFAYRFVAGQKPFYVRAMYHDDRFTYIQARPEETPTLYEVKDGKPNLVNFQYDNGVYVVDKVLDSGYLVVGKARLKFTREE
jgi:type IV secretion system protein VirB9